MSTLSEKPIFIFGCNRSGTTLLFWNLSENPDLWSHYVEIQEVYQDREFFGQIPPRFFQRPLNRLYQPPTNMLAEKTSANSLRIPFLAEAFPDARFIYVARRGEAVVSSPMEGWKRWNNVPGGEPFVFKNWHYLVPPGWQEDVDEPSESICAFQWIESNRIAHQDLEQLARDGYLLVRQEDLVGDPATAYGRIQRFCELRESENFDSIIS